MDISGISSNALLACFFAILGGLIRIVLKVDSCLPIIKQFILLFIAAMPSGYFAFKAATDYGFEKAAYPLSFIVGIMALSLVSMIAKKGAAEIVRLASNIVSKKTK